MKLIIIFICLLFAFQFSICKSNQEDFEDMFSLGIPSNLTFEHGKLSFGVEKPLLVGKASGLNFAISELIQHEDGFTVFGLTRSDEGRPQIWRSYTTNGFTFSDAKMIFEVPQPDSIHSNLGDITIKGEKILYMNCHLVKHKHNGRHKPLHHGHPFHAYSGGLNGGGWVKLNKNPIYFGQDALNIVWNEQLKKFVNYQISFQPFPKRYPDNLPKIRRVLHIRTSPDGLNWTPGDSFGPDGPYLSDDQFIVPDSLDDPDLEFYHLSAIDLGNFWAGAMVNYVSQPEEIPNSPNLPHGPFLSAEWWVSSDGLIWERPFRENSMLDGGLINFAQRIGKPMLIGDTLLWVVNKSVYTLDQNRMFYSYSRGNAVVKTKDFTLSGKPIELDVSFESIKRNDPKHLTQGYIMVELLDSQGNVISGFEKEKCIIMPTEETKVVLKWVNSAFQKITQIWILV